MKKKTRAKLLDLLAQIEITASLISNHKGDNNPYQMEFYAEALHVYVKNAIRALGVLEARFSEICDEI